MPRLTCDTMAGHKQYHNPFWSLEVVAGWPCGFPSPLGTQNRLAKKSFVSDKHNLSAFACHTKGVCDRHTGNLLPGVSCSAQRRVVAKRSSSNILRPGVCFGGGGGIF